MKTLHIASILALSATLTFACGGDDDSAPDGGAGSGGKAAAGETHGGEGGADASAGGEAPECHLLGEGGQGGAGGEGPGLGVGLEIIGSWEESFGGNLEITSQSWNDSIIREYDNDDNVVYAQNSCAAFFPAKFSKYVYTEPTNDSFYYCTVVYDAATLEAAKASDATADEGNLDTGCSGFPWSKVTKQ